MITASLDSIIRVWPRNRDISRNRKQPSVIGNSLGLAVGRQGDNIADSLIGLVPCMLGLRQHSHLQRTGRFDTVAQDSRQVALQSVTEKLCPVSECATLALFRGSLAQTDTVGANTESHWQRFLLASGQINRPSHRSSHLPNWNRIHFDLVSFNLCNVSEAKGISPAIIYSTLVNMCACVSACMYMHAYMCTNGQSRLNFKVWCGWKTWWKRHKKRGRLQLRWEDHN